VPGNYTVTLDYGGQKTQQTLTVALDPRLKATQQGLQARLDLDLQIHADLDTLDKDINQAIATRDKLQKAVASKSVTDAQTAPMLKALNNDINAFAQMEMRASEGALLHETKLRDHLAYLAADIDLSYDRPTAAHNAVFHELDQKVKEGKQKLEADVAEADKVAAPDSAASEMHGLKP